VSAEGARLPDGQGSPARGGQAAYGEKAFKPDDSPTGVRRRRISSQRRTGSLWWKSRVRQHTKFRLLIQTCLPVGKGMAGDTQGIAGDSQFLY